MNAPTNRAEARDLIRKVIADCDLAERGLREDLEDAIADMLLEQISSAKRDGAYDVERKTLDPVFKLIGSAKIHLDCMKAFRLLQRHAPEALRGNNWEPELEDFIRGAVDDIAKAQELDDRIPF